MTGTKVSPTNYAGPPRTARSMGASSSPRGTSVRTDRRTQDRPDGSPFPLWRIATTPALPSASLSKGYPRPQREQARRRPWFSRVSGAQLGPRGCREPGRSGLRPQASAAPKAVRHSRCAEAGVVRRHAPQGHEICLNRTGPGTRILYVRPPRGIARPARRARAGLCQPRRRAPIRDEIEQHVLGPLGQSGVHRVTAS